MITAEHVRELMRSGESPGQLELGESNAECSTEEACEREKESLLSEIDFRIRRAVADGTTSIVIWRFDDPRYAAEVMVPAMQQLQSDLEQLGFGVQMEGRLSKYAEPAMHGGMPAAQTLMTIKWE